MCSPQGRQDLRGRPCERFSLQKLLQQQKLRGEAGMIAASYPQRATCITRLHSQTVTLLSCCLGSAHFTGLLPQRCRVIKSTLSHVHLAQATQRHSTIVVLMAIDPLRHRQLLVPNLRASIYSTGAPVHLCKAPPLGSHFVALLAAMDPRYIANGSSASDAISCKRPET